MTTLWKKLEPFMLMVAVAVSRFALRSHRLYDLDSVNFALGMQQFSPRLHQPHPPGYFLYICFARFVNFFVHDPNLTLVLVSIAASCGTVAVIYKMASEWAGLMAARFASLVFFFSPLGWFHGIVALTYSVEALFSASVGWLCWRINSRKISTLVAASLILGISAGVRPSSFVFLGPLYLYSLRTLRFRQKLIGVAILLLTLAAWFVPMILLSGGFHAYFEALATLWKAVPSKGTAFNSSPANTIARAFVILFIGLLMCGTWLFILVDALARKTAAEADKMRFTLIWISPALCFYTFVFLKFVNSGYLLLLLPAASIWLGWWLADWYQRSTLSAVGKVALIAFCATANTLIFLVSPLYCSYRSVREFEAQLQEATSALPLAAEPNDTLVIGFDSHFLGYRHAGYYLPGYTTVEYPEIHSPEGPRIFSLEGRKTSLLAELPQKHFERFVFFPLPTGDPDYTAYLAKVERLLSGHRLEVRRVGHYDFVTGPVTLLPLLFPQTSHASNSAVYPRLHARTGDVYTNVNTSTLDPASPRVNR